MSQTLRIPLLLAFLLVLPLPGRSETLYVTNRMVAPVHDVPGGKVVAELPTGSPVELLGVTRGYARVKIDGGPVGWIARDLLTSNIPLEALLLRLADQQQRTQRELEQARRHGGGPFPLWPLIIGSALMLAIGFGLGVFWLDRRIRERHGGLRV